MPTSPKYLPRPHLAEKLRESISKYSLTTVVAPLGYGKTTLAHEVAESGQGSIWYYLTPPGPHDASYLWHDLCDSLESQGIGLAPAWRRSGFPETASQRRRTLEALNSLTSPASLIIDDFQQVTDPALSDFWASAVRTEIPHFHLAVFSRNRPALGLEELSLKKLAVVYEQDFLAFSESETQEYFRLNGVREAAAAAEAHQYSEGWPAALWLCLRSWLISGRIMEDGDIDSLLAHTVFADFSPSERDLMMRLSVLETFSDHDAVQIAAADGLPVRLRTLREKNAFLTFNAKTGHYYFHSLFKDFLRKELAAAAQIEKPALYRLAGERCLSRADTLGAFRLFLRAGRQQDLRRILDLFLRPEYDSVLAFFQEEIFTATTGLPWSIRLSNPLGYLAFVAVCLVIWNDGRAAYLLDEAEARFGEAEEIPDYLGRQLQGEIEVIRGLLAFNDGWTLKEHYERASLRLPGPSMVLSKGTAWSFGSPSLSFLFLRDRGRYREVVEMTGQYWHLYRKMSGGLGKAAEKVILAEHCLEQGQLAEAGRLARESLRSCQADKHLAGALIAAFCLARLAIAEARPSEAVATLEALRPRVEQFGVIDHLEGFDLALGYTAAGLGRLELVPQWLRDGEIFDPPHNALPQVAGLGLTIHGKALMLADDYRELATLAEDIPTCTAPLECHFARLHSTILRAIAAWHTRSQTEGAALMEEALELSRPDGILLTPAEYGGHIRPILRHLSGFKSEDKHLAAILALAESIAHATERANSRKELLAPREREVMRLVITGLSNQAIAAKLGISSDTVKKALNRAYKKLQAANRAEAARRFVELESDKN